MTTTHTPEAITATDPALWADAMNSLLFLTADLGPSINA